MYVRLFLTIFILFPTNLCLEIKLRKFHTATKSFLAEKDVVVKNLDNLKIFLNLGEHNFIQVTNGGEISTFEDFPEVEYVWMPENDLKTTPLFSNVPKLSSIDLTKNDIERIPKEAFASTNLSSIFLTNNQIRQIDDESFGKNLYWLQLACNALKTFSPAWFQNPSKLYLLNLDGNDIEHIESTAFDLFSSLGDLNLSYNKIKRLEPGTLSFTNWLAWVHLQNNGLTELNQDVFQSPVTIHGLNIQYNNLTYLSNDFMDNLHIKLFVNVVGNPWQCSCFESIAKWVKWEEYGKSFFPKKVEGEPSCVLSKASPDSCEADVADRQELIDIFGRARRTPLDREMYCKKYRWVTFHPCVEKDICFHQLP